jgi:translation initiation factor IF-2
VIGFNVNADTAARRLAEAEGVSIRIYSIIYRLIEDIEKALRGMLAPEYKEVILGRADVLRVFKISHVGDIAGCRVSQGEIKRGGKARVIRASQVIHLGELASLKHEKDDVKEVRNGLECGISFKGFNEFAVGDVVECFILQRVAEI